MKEYAVINLNPEHAVIEREVNPKDIFFTKFLFYQKCLNEIKRKPEHQGVKSEYIKEKRPDKKGLIVLNFIEANYFKEWLSIDNYLNVKDIIFFKSNIEYLNQFNK